MNLGVRRRMVWVLCSVPNQKKGVTIIGNKNIVFIGSLCEYVNTRWERLVGHACISFGKFIDLIHRGPSILTVNPRANA